MSKADEKRQRVKADFRFELPIRYKQPELDEASFNSLLDALETSSRKKGKSARTAILKMARDHIAWRRLAERKTPRPSANRCFLAMASDARKTMQLLGALPKQSEQRLWQFFDLELISERAKPGFEDLQRVGRIIAELGSAVGGIMYEVYREGGGRAVGLAKLEKLRAHSEAFSLNVLYRLPVQTSLDLIATPGFSEVAPAYDQHRSPQAYVETIIENFAYLCDVAYEIACLARGPRLDTPMFFIVNMLAELWQDCTGRKPMHTAHNGFDYTGVPQTPFGKFVLAFMKLVEPRPTDRKVPRVPRGTIEAVADVVWASSRKKKAHARALSNRAHDEEVQRILTSRICHI